MCLSPRIHHGGLSTFHQPVWPSPLSGRLWFSGSSVCTSRKEEGNISSFFLKSVFFLLWMSSLIYLLFCFYLNRRINWCSLWQDSNESLHCWAAASFVLIKVICFCTSKKETWSKEREESGFWAKHECFWFIRTVVNYCSFSIISLTLAPLHKFSTIFLAVQEMLLY